MAARKNKIRRGENGGRFYVYCVHDGDGFPVYIGKGCGRRASNQSRRFARPVYILKRFRAECDAFKYERKQIDDLRPQLNQCAGGGGSRAMPKPAIRKAAWEYEIERVGSRRYAARELLRFDLTPYLDASKIDAIRRVADGPRV